MSLEEKNKKGVIHRVWVFGQRVSTTRLGRYIRISAYNRRLPRGKKFEEMKKFLLENFGLELIHPEKTDLTDFAESRQEYEQFPNGAHDDMLDSLALLLSPSFSLTWPGDDGSWKRDREFTESVMTEWDGPKGKRSWLSA
jgi:hypothetical protein